MHRAYKPRGTGQDEAIAESTCPSSVACHGFSCSHYTGVEEAFKRCSYKPWGTGLYKAIVASTCPPSVAFHGTAARTVRLIVVEECYKRLLTSLGVSPQQPRYAACHPSVAPAASVAPMIKPLVRRRGGLQASAYKPRGQPAPACDA